MLSGTSDNSRSLSDGTNTVLIPDLKAANNFSFKPPIGSTRPLSDISPVIATSFFTGIPAITEIIAIIIATPADGPSFGVAPSGTWTWISFLWKIGGSIP